MIKHLKVKGISCQRSKSLADISLVKIPNSQSIPERVDAVTKNLAKRKTGKPRTLKTLRSTIRALFVDQLGDEELDRLIGQLTERGIIEVADGKVDYKLPP